MSLSRRQLLRSLVAAPIAVVMAPVVAKANAGGVANFAIKVRGLNGLPSQWVALRGPEAIMPIRRKDFMSHRHAGIMICEDPRYSSSGASKFRDGILKIIDDRKHDAAAIDSMMNEGGRDFEGAY